jgi:hypothetical protein
MTGDTMPETVCKNVVIAARINLNTYTLLSHMSEHTHIRKSSLLRAAITQWLQNAPKDLPLDLRIEITRTNMQHQIETAKNLRWTYH